ncbi:MAG: DEAD/DEAH box helicase [Bacteroidia bacterium]|nr:MAG: DEAD/DEAH box helicase [Bacteroidia bacterium]
MSIFELHERVLADYGDFVGSFVNIHDERLRAFVRRMLEEERQLWPEPLLQLSPSYQRAQTVEELAQEGVLHEETARIFRRAGGESFRLFRHQVEAIRLAAEGKSFVVTSGTGSGKSFCYFIPIVDAVVRTGVSGLVALVVYPMNALVNSQEQALRELANRYRERTGREMPVRFARYTGETPEEEREQIRRHPPHILLTNYVMAELLLVRPEDRPLLALPSPPSSLAASQPPFFLVFDELHTYRGRQGADVAMLVRRLRSRLERSAVVHIGTSATLVAHPGATPQERRQVVADFASRFFGTRITPQEIVEETLEPATVGGFPTAQELVQALDEPFPQEGEALRRHPLARWVEYAMGVEEEADGHLRRRPPRSLSEVAEALAQYTGQPPDTCQARLQAFFTHLAQRNRQLSEPFFAFKLHQFISQGRAVYATLEPPAERKFSAEGEGVAELPLFPLRFCRLCGQDYYHVVRTADGRFLPYPVGEEPPEEVGQGGYLAFVEDWNESYLPDDWRDEQGRLTRTWRDRVPQLVWVRPDGTLAAGPASETHQAWWQARKFWLCLRCGEYYTEREQDFTKLSHLSSEGRSSATTVLATAVLRAAKQTGTAVRDKLLTFTDSRQDASLQAGHFNDFVQMAVLRSGLYAALAQHGQLRFDTLTSETVRHMGLDLKDIAQNPSLDPRSALAQEVWKTFEDLTEYRLYADLRRGWRVLQPNLEEVGLLRLAYQGLSEACERDEIWEGVPVLRSCPPQERFRIVHAVLDHFRKRLAIGARVLEKSFQQQLRRRAGQHLNEFWGLDPDADFLYEGRWFVRPTGQATRLPPGEFYRLSGRTALGRFLQEALGLDAKGLEGFLPPFLEVLVRQGFLQYGHPLRGYEGYRLEAACLVWQVGDAAPPPPDPVYARGGRETMPANAFFQRLYSGVARELASLEAREHTAQVVSPGERQRRERRFRWLPEDAQDPSLGRRLPYLVCSPTMELGVDIADLDVVHLRNVPPTPANYAQRSGRAGRQGQAGLILTYCAAWSSHDQYFFRHRAEMVAGAVRAPRLDLANEALIRAHIQAEWLAQVGLPLRQSIEEVVNTEHSPAFPLREGVAQQIRLGEEQQGRLRERLQRILAFDRDVLEKSGWFGEPWLKRVIEEAPEAFDRAFDRWRELFRMAEAQLKQAQDELTRARKPEDQQQAERRQKEALRQRNLLLQVGVAPEESDFYPYRYLATEGFLPGYNFPALPVRAWVPRGEGEFMARPRALAIREFAPHNIVYHEGAKWQVRRFFLPPGGLEQRRRKLRLCLVCGTFVELELKLERCPVCSTLFDGTNSQVETLLDLPNVRLVRRERITSNEEERVRLGYDLQVFYQFAPVESGYRTVEADVQTSEGVPFRLIYAPAATLLHINRGWRGRSGGFFVDLNSGELLTDAQVEQELKSSGGPPSTAHRERTALCVWATHNVLLLRLLDPRLQEKVPVLEATLLYALKRGMEQVFQLEENELGVQRIGQQEHRALLFYEAAEGGLGVLRRLVEEPGALALVAQEALRICHTAPDGADQKPECKRACYECLLSFQNQMESHLLDRRRIQPLLQELSTAQVALRIKGVSREEHLAWLWKQTQSELERRFLTFLAEGGYRLPDKAQKSIQEPRCIADFFYEPRVVLFCDGPVHDRPDQRRIDGALRERLQEQGYRVLVLRAEENLEGFVRAHPDVFGMGASFAQSLGGHPPQD